MRQVKIGVTSDVAPGTMKKFYLDGKEILVANIDDSFYAISDKCPHMGGSLSAGTLDGSTVKCPRHGTVIDLKTGKVLQNPKMMFVTVKLKNEAPVYPLKIHGKDIIIELV